MMDDDLIPIVRTPQKSIEEMFKCGEIWLWSNDSQWIDEENERVSELK